MRGEGRSYLKNRPIKNSLRFERWKKCVFSSLQFKGREYFSLLLYLASLGVTMERIKTINLTSYQSCNKIWKRYRVSFQGINFYGVYVSKFYAHNNKNNMGTEIVITKTILKVLRSKHGTNARSKDNPNSECFHGIIQLLACPMYFTTIGFSIQEIIIKSHLNANER